MSDVCRAELQWIIDDLSKYLKKNRNHLALGLYRQMNRDDCLGRYGHIYAHNDEYDIDIEFTRRKNGKEEV